MLAVHRAYSKDFKNILMVKLLRQKTEGLLI